MKKKLCHQTSRNSLDASRALLRKVRQNDSLLISKQNFRVLQ